MVGDDRQTSALSLKGNSRVLQPPALYHAHYQPDGVAAGVADELLRAVN
ncbi:hypothetical protein GR223_13115 [Rhizobium leguminosarum]|nr:hypothetical protein [Rhizobium ruizarguesonis]NEH76264.1 hypothetical protein [Rhizobium ruizarguesonis]NEJ86868.1 hypothetical protein [Rhizobium ruizarguesonis]NEJ93077.1 hypothetical protein [Rhizobium ruizarguesonis]